MRPNFQRFLDPGRYAHAKRAVLRCEYCDFTYEVTHLGPHDVNPKTCQNPACWAYKLVRLVPSLK